MPRRRTRFAKRLAKPHWDGRRLWWVGDVIRDYRRIAPRQMAVLEAFESGGWPAQIGIDSNELLRGQGTTWLLDTVKNLNRRIAKIRFHADGSKHGIAWRPA